MRALLSGRRSCRIRTGRAAKTKRTAAINAARDARLAAGCRVTFPDGDGALTFKSDRELIHHRDLLDRASAMVAAGDGDTTFPTPYRDEENVNHAVTAQQLADITADARDWYTATWLHASGWKDLVLAAETLAAVAAVAPATGWPDNDLTH